MISVSDQVGTIFLETVQVRKHCFLAQPEWNELLGGPPVNDAASTRKPHSIVALIVHLPGIVCRYEESAANEDAIVAAELWRDTDRIHRGLESWLEQSDSFARCSTDRPASTPGNAGLLQIALSVASSTFTTLTQYMLLDLNDRQVPAVLHVEHTCSSSAIDRQNIVELCHDRSTVARNSYDTVKTSDPVAAWAIGAPTSMMIRRVLKASKGNDDTALRLRPILQGLCDTLLDDD